MNSDVFMALERQIEFTTDSAEIQAYLRSTFARTRLASALPDAPLDRALLRERDPREIRFNGRALPMGDGFAASPFHFGFYGSARVLRESFRQNPRWFSLHAVAVTLARGALILIADSAVGKTTLALALLDRGARLLSDEFVFVRKSDRTVSGYPRTLMIREPSLAELPNPRLQAVCAAAESRRSSLGFRIWHAIDPAEIYGPAIFASPTPLAAIVLLEHRRSEARTRCEPLLPGIAALELSRRLNSGIEGFARLAELIECCSNVEAVRVTLGRIDATADRICRELG